MCLALKIVQNTLNKGEVFWIPRSPYWPVLGMPLPTLLMSGMFL